MPHSPEQVTLDGHPQNPEQDPLTGTLLDDRFLIEERIATGGFGAIYRARTADGELVAIKILHPRLTGDPNMVARFRREGATLMQLHDPHTVTTLAVGETRDGTLYIAMELLSGESLHARLCREGALAWPTAVEIARSVCSSLAEAHATGVVHRDLKPDNIHVETGGNGENLVKVIDFGIVKIARGSSIDDGNELTLAGHMIGTYDYMSPEQIVGAPCRDLSDIYSLGVVLYEMLTGRRPFAEVTGPASMMTALLTQTPSPPSRFAAIPPELDRIVMRCLAREPEDRFRNIGELADTLDHLLAGPDQEHEGITVQQPACRSIPTAQFSSAVPSVVPSAALPHDACPSCAQAPRAAGFDPRGFGPMLEPCGEAALFTTLPGIAVATRPRIARGSHPILPMPLPEIYPVVPLGWQSAAQAGSQMGRWIPSPAIPFGQLASSGGPQLPARSYGTFWVAILIACAAAIMIAAIHWR